MKTLTRRDFLKGAAAGALGTAVTYSFSLTGFASEAPAAANAAGLKPVFDGHGNTFEYGHFTAEAIVIDANSEEMNPNAVFSVYHIMDYTAEVPYADSTPANGVTDQNNTSSMYVIISGNDALMIDLGNGPSATAGHFGEDASDQAVLDRIDQELRELVFSLVEDRHFEIAITHKHGDHVGFSTAFAGLGLKVYFPEQDNSERIEQRFADYEFETFVPGELQLTVGDIAIDTLLCEGHTDGSTIFTITTPVITYNYAGTNPSATYIVFSGDAVGSGSSVWIFALAGMQQLNGCIDGVVKQLESYTEYDAGLGAGVQKGAQLLLLGGHGWQYDNRFGRMRMDIEYVKSMQMLCHLLSDRSRWKYDGVDGLTLEDWMRRGYVTLKNAQSGTRYTAYYGTTLTSSAAITGPFEMMEAFAAEAEE